MEELRLFIDEMQATSSSLDKVAILKRQSKFIQKVLEYTYNPYKQYHVTSKTCIKNMDKGTTENDYTLFEILDKLNNREVTGHSAIKLVNSQDILIYKIIDKDLKIRTGAKVINKAFPGLIPESNFLLAYQLSFQSHLPS